MHPFAWIPLATVFGAAALAAAIAARETGQRANRLVAAVLLCDAWWALFELLCLTAQNASAALLYARMASFGSILLSPVALHLLLVVMPEPLLRYRWLLAAQYAIGAALVLACLGGPWFTPAVVRVSWGFAPVIGPLVPWAYLALMLVPLIALLRVLRLRTLARVPRTSASPSVEIAIGFTVLVASVTDFLLPSLGKPFPARQRERRRLGPRHLVDGLSLPRQRALAAPVRERDPRHASRRRRAGAPRRSDSSAQRPARAAGQADPGRSARHAPRRAGDRAGGSGRRRRARVRADQRRRRARAGFALGQLPV